VFLVEGSFFSILFNVSPKDLVTPCLVDEITLDIDPMLHRPADAGARRPISIALTGYLAEWQRRFHIRGAYEPLPEAERDRRLAAIHTRLPDDYLELIRQSEGLDIEGCSIFGLGQIREL